MLGYTAVYTPHIEDCYYYLQREKSSLQHDIHFDHSHLGPSYEISGVMKTTLTTLLAFLGAAQAQNVTRGAAMMRFACSQLTVERLDPLVNPGVVGRLANAHKTCSFMTTDPFGIS